MRGIHEPSLGERRVPYGRDHERHFPDRNRSFHLDWNDLKESRRSVQRAADAKVLVLNELDGGDRPSSVMTFDRNPKPVQFIQPNLLDRACLSVGKDDGFADQFGLRLAVLIQNF